MKTWLILLLLVPLAAANHDGDAIEDDAEALACGTGRNRDTLDALGGSAGSCSSPKDYEGPQPPTTPDVPPIPGAPGVPAPPEIPQTPEVPDPVDLPLPSAPDSPGVPESEALPLSSCDEFGQCEATWGYPAILMTPAESTDPANTPPIYVGPTGPYATPRVQPPPTGIRGEPNGGFYCLSAPNGIVVCPDVGPLLPFLPTLDPGSIEIPAQQIGPTPPIRRDSDEIFPGHNQESIVVDLEVTARYRPDRFNERVRSNAGSLWEPVDLDDQNELDWWRISGEATSLTVTVTTNGESSQFEVPMAGQAWGAMQTNMSGQA